MVFLPPGSFFCALKAAWSAVIWDRSFAREATAAATALNPCFSKRKKSWLPNQRHVQLFCCLLLFYFAFPGVEARVEFYDLVAVLGELHGGIFASPA